MRLRTLGLIVTLALGILAAPLAARAQQAGRVPRIGFLTTGASPVPWEAFRQGLRDLGYVEGQNIVIERRSAAGKVERLPDLAVDLVGLKVDVIVAPDPPAAGAAKNATKTIPVVVRTSDDPVAMGLVASLARPGGNITGLTSLWGELSGKRLELLKEVVPRISRVAVLWNPAHPGAILALRETEVAARSLGLQLQSLEVRGPNPDFEGAFGAAARERAGALITLRNPLIVRHRTRIVNLAAKSRLPAMYDEREFVEAGGLTSYGANLSDLNRRAAVYVDKILKGAKPADLPVEQPTKFELVINRKTAKALGLTIPQSILIRADEVIQ
ncbi:MAG: ABC transporter substrate-binding protein [Candidatus Rokubacteria bacterium]|nr:ABC transporter substrate-binding protein [Candidatus Rokubacteria bacterium]